MGYGKISSALCMLVAASMAMAHGKSPATDCIHATVERSYVQSSRGLFIDEALLRGQQFPDDRWLEVTVESEKKSALPSRKLFRCAGCGPIKSGIVVSICKKPSNALVRDVLTTWHSEEDFFEWFAILAPLSNSLLLQPDLRSSTKQGSRGASK